PHGFNERRTKRGIRLAAQPATLLPFFERSFFGGFVPAEPGHQVVEIHFVSVEVRSVDTGESDVIADFYAAPAAHAGAVDHHGIEADHGLDLVRPRGVGAA